MFYIFAVIFIAFCVSEVLLIVRFGKSGRKLERGVSVCVLTGFILLLAAEYALRFRIPYYVLILSLLFAFLHTFCGYYLDYYNRSRIFDRWLHCFGAFSLSLLSYFLIAAFVSPGGSRGFRGLFVFFTGVALGSLFEIHEFRTDRTRGTRMQKGLKDTDTDMICNTAGSALAAAFAFFVFL